MINIITYRDKILRCISSATSEIQCISCQKMIVNFDNYYGSFKLSKKENNLVQNLQSLMYTELAEHNTKY